MNFKMAEKLGMRVEKLSEPEEIDNKMEELVNEKYDTIILSNELAGFSSDIIKKYQNNSNINIIIGTRK